MQFATYCVEIKIHFIGMHHSLCPHVLPLRMMGLGQKFRIGRAFDKQIKRRNIRQTSIEGCTGYWLCRTSSQCFCWISGRISGWIVNIEIFFKKPDIKTPDIRFSPIYTTRNGSVYQVNTTQVNALQLVPAWRHRSARPLEPSSSPPQARNDFLYLQMIR